jgi:hypothetical protein
MDVFDISEMIHNEINVINGKLLRKEGSEEFPEEI